MLVDRVTVSPRAAPMPHVYRGAGTTIQANRFFRIHIRQLPEGVWLASSSEIPGLFVEGDSSDEARQEAVVWGRELLRENLGLNPDRNMVFVFDDGVERVYARP